MQILLDNNHEISTEILTTKRLFVAVNPDYVTDGPAMSLSSAVRADGLSLACYYATEWHSNEEHGTISAEPDKLLEFFVAYGHQFRYVCHPTKPYFVYMEQFNRYHIVGGDRRFLAVADNRDVLTQEIELTEWLSDSGLNTAEKAFLMKIFDRYRPFMMRD